MELTTDRSVSLRQVQGAHNIPTDGSFTGDENYVVRATYSRPSHRVLGLFGGGERTVTYDYMPRNEMPVYYTFASAKK